MKLTTLTAAKIRNANQIMEVNIIVEVLKKISTIRNRPTTRILDGPPIVLLSCTPVLKRMSTIKAAMERDIQLMYRVNIQDWPKNPKVPKGVTIGGR